MYHYPLSLSLSTWIFCLCLSGVVWTLASRFPLPSPPPLQIQTSQGQDIPLLPPHVLPVQPLLPPSRPRQDPFEIRGRSTQPSVYELAQTKKNPHKNEHGHSSSVPHTENVDRQKRKDKIRDRAPLATPGRRWKTSFPMMPTWSSWV
ncbi:hypothetical protein IE53DRAFT_153764 [Violaceomyces palustris]|uniref:Uncharacterized protein n=1 Tax=Violaceomyces palustris TaxID=1673888 RepID=A0ACD0P6F7_9BASI|nr:hypothetical protein IE53DRAFT_153764 [Violaceomyces palustris]